MEQRKFRPLSDEQPTDFAFSYGNLNQENEYSYRARLTRGSINLTDRRGGGVAGAIDLTDRSIGGLSNAIQLTDRRVGGLLNAIQLTDRSVRGIPENNESTDRLISGSTRSNDEAYHHTGTRSSTDHTAYAPVEVDWGFANDAEIPTRRSSTRHASMPFEKPSHKGYDHGSDRKPTPQRATPKLSCGS